MDCTRFRFAGFVVGANRSYFRKDDRVARFATAHRRVSDNCVFHHELDDPGQWDEFRIDRVLKQHIPEAIRSDALAAVSTLAADARSFGRPNVCLGIDAVRSLLAAARIPREPLQILELGIPHRDAELLISREDACADSLSEHDKPHGIVSAVRLNRPLTGTGQQLGIEPWYMDRRLRYSWRERHDSRAVRRRAFARLNEHGLLRDLIDFELFVPGLVPRIVRNRDVHWLPVLLVEHSVESVIGDRKPAVRSGRVAL